MEFKTLQPLKLQPAEKIVVNRSQSCLSGGENRFVPNKAADQGEGKYDKYLVNTSFAPAPASELLNQQGISPTGALALPPPQQAIKLKIIKVAKRFHPLRNC